MQRFIIVLTVLLLTAPFVPLVLRRGEGGQTEVVRPPAALLDSNSAPLPAEVTGPTEPDFRMPEEDSVFRHAAEVAWQYVDTQYQPATGLVNSVLAYPYATIWDVASTLAAYYSAEQLGLMDEGVYHDRTARALRTLQELPLFANSAFNKNYEVRRGVAMGRGEREVTSGYGWSSTDLGRLLIWLRIVAEAHPEHRAAVDAVVRRLDFERIVRDGYLYGADLDPAGRRREYPEGRLGYEQYSAAGFALWDQFADRALSLNENAEESTVLGVPMLADRRGGAHLTSEPFLLMGMEVGWWSPEWRELASSVLRAQQTRYERTGQVTIVSEDAVPTAPYYFYYYTVEYEGDDFAVVSLTSDAPLPGPRWISSKAALAWYAIEPSPYTWRAVQAVQPAADGGRGWSAGVYEESGRSTGGQNINTAAVILEAALYHRDRQPILASAGTSAVPDSTLFQTPSR